MTERISEKKFVAEVFGREQSANNLARKAAASIYHSVFLHNPPRDPKLLGGIKKNLSKLINKEDLEVLTRAHSDQTDLNL